MLRAVFTTTTHSAPGVCRRWPSRRSAGYIPTIRCGAIFPMNTYFDRLAIDVINGGPALREWVDDAGSKPGDLEVLAGADEVGWRSEIGRFLLYR